jgi:hypothetical protein
MDSISPHPKKLKKLWALMFSEIPFMDIYYVSERSVASRLQYGGVRFSNMGII